MNWTKVSNVAIFTTVTALTVGAGNAMAGPVLDRISERGVVTLCTNVNNPPNVFIDSSGKAQGMQVDLMNNMRAHLSEVVGKELNYELVPTLPANRVEFLDRGKCDVIFTSLTVTPERQRLIQFIEPYYYAAGAGLQTRDDVTIESWEALKNKRICSNQGSSWNLPLERNYGAEIVALQSQQEVDQSLRDGRCIALVSDDSYLQARFLTDDKGYWTGYKVQELKAFSEGPWGLAIKFGDDDLQATLSEMVASWHASGLIAEEAQKWGFTPPQFVSDMQQKYQNQ